jgi:ribosome-associated heat shock protein Hsp15
MQIGMRLDQWLWAVRVFKTRTLAAEAIKGGHVRINDQPCKPAREVRAGDTVVARVGIMTRTVRFIADPPSRVGAKLVPQFAEDLTPPEEYARRPEPNLLPPMFRPQGAGRPTKRDRRETDRLGEG